MGKKVTLEISDMYIETMKKLGYDVDILESELISIIYKSLREESKGYIGKEFSCDTVSEKSDTTINIPSFKNSKNEYSSMYNKLWRNGGE